MSSLFKHVTLPLLAVAAAGTLTASLCATTHAATASFDYCGAVSVNGQQGIGERVKCSITASGSEWWEVDYSATQVGGGDPHAATKNPYLWGPGDYYYPSAPQAIFLGPTISGTYNCSAVCHVGNSGGDTTANTSGTHQVTF